MPTALKVWMQLSLQSLHDPRLKGHSHRLLDKVLNCYTAGPGSDTIYLPLYHYNTITIADNTITIAAKNLSLNLIRISTNRW